MMNPKLGRQDLILLPQATLRQIDNAAHPDFGSGFYLSLVSLLHNPYTCTVY